MVDVDGLFVVKKGGPLRGVKGTIVNSREFRPMEIFLFVAFVYLCCGVAASAIGAWLERTMATEELRLEASSAA